MSVSGPSLGPPFLLLCAVSRLRGEVGSAPSHSSLPLPQRVQTSQLLPHWDLAGSTCSFLIRENTQVAHFVSSR